MRFLAPAALIGVLLPLSVAASAAAPPSDPQSTFHAGTAEWVAAYNAGEPDRIMALYSTDAVVMPPDATTVSGDAALHSFLADDIANSKKAGITLAIASDDEADASGDLGWHRGTFQVIGAGGATVGTGKYLEIWQKQKGQWRIIRDIWNNDAPATAPAPQPQPQPAAHPVSN